MKNILTDGWKFCLRSKRSEVRILSGVPLLIGNQQLTTPVSLQTRRSTFCFARSSDNSDHQLTTWPKLWGLTLDRRGFIAALVAPFVARFLPKPKPPIPIYVPSVGVATNTVVMPAQRRGKSIAMHVVALGAIAQGKTVLIVHADDHRCPFKVCGGTREVRP